MGAAIATRILSIGTNIDHGAFCLRICSSLSCFLKASSINLGCLVWLLLSLACRSHFLRILVLCRDWSLFLMRLTTLLFLSCLRGSTFCSWIFIFFVYLIFLFMTRDRGWDPLEHLDRFNGLIEWLQLR